MSHQSSGDYQSDLQENFKHQVIIPRSRLANLIVQNYHKLVLHAGEQTTLHQVPEKFWIINERNYVRRILHQCITCNRFAKDLIPKWALSRKKGLLLDHLSRTLGLISRVLSGQRPKQTARLSTRLTCVYLYASP